MSSHRFVRREQRQSEAEPGAVKRYWPGRAPDWYKEEKEEEEEQDGQSEDEAAPSAFGKLAVEDGPTFAVAAPTIVKKVDHLHRLIKHSGLLSAQASSPACCCTACRDPGLLLGCWA